jgi:hypothetical protein
MTRLNSTTFEKLLIEPLELYVLNAELSRLRASEGHPPLPHLAASQDAYLHARYCLAAIREALTKGST